MKIKKENLLPAIAMPCFIASSRKNLPILNMVRIEASNSRLSIHGSDLDQEAIVECECSGDLKPVCVSAKSLRDFVSTAGDKLDISLNGGSKIILKSNSVCEFSTLPAEEFPPAMAKKMKPVGVRCDDLSRAINLVYWAASKDPTGYTLNSVHIALSPKNLTCQATTGRVLAVFSMPSICAAHELLIPEQFSKQLADELAKEGAELFAGENAVTVKHKAGSYSFKLVEGSFPSTKNFLETAGRKPIAEIDAAEWIGVFNSLCLLVPVETQFKDKELKATLEFSAKKVETKSVAKDGTAFKAEILGKFAATEPLNVNAQNILKAMSVFKPGKPVKFWRKDDNFIGFSQDELDIFSSLMGG